MLGQIFAFMACFISSFLLVFCTLIICYCVLCDAYNVNIEDSKFGNIIYKFAEVIYIFLIEKDKGDESNNGDAL